MQATSDRSAEHIRKAVVLGGPILTAISEPDLLRLINRLMVVARRYYVGRISCEDVVSQTLTDVFSGKRLLDPNLTLYKNLCRILRSVGSNQGQKEKRFISLEDVPEDTICSQVAWDVAVVQAPDKIYEHQLYTQSLADILNETTQSNEYLAQIVESALDAGRWKNKDIAQQLNIERKHVRNAKKLMRRRLAPLAK